MFCHLLCASNDNLIGIKYLEEAKHIFENWKQSGNSSLTSETFLACTQSISAIPELIKYLKLEHGIEYVLPGKLLSDPIEGRFGWYRQVNRGNFYISVRQLLLAKKKSLLNTFSALGRLEMSLEKIHRVCLDIPEHSCNSCNSFDAKNVNAKTLMLKMF